MSVDIRIPKGVAEELRRKADDLGLSIVEYIIEIALQGLDSSNRTKKYAESALELLKHAKEELKKGNPRQASEKIWGATALAIKAYASWREGKRITSHSGLWEYERILTKDIGDWVDDSWRHAVTMHVNFYEGWASREHVERSLEKVEKLVITIIKRIEQR